MDSPVVVITGAVTGIGRATVLAFADSGAHLVAASFVTGQIVSVDGGKNGGLMPNPQQSGALS
ncbi:hypothetical protein [Paraburkholderia sediminicola]|uniref:hypothetical protein n=1 Tax=Paraburkholderia sediminicola TaxID=458836 RepID=UPI0038B9F428